jgi:hypothetical protein
MAAECMSPVEKRCSKLKDIEWGTTYNYELSRMWKGATKEHHLLMWSLWFGARVKLRVNPYLSLLTFDTLNHSNALHPPLSRPCQPAGVMPTNLRDAILNEEPNFAS